MWTEVTNEEIQRYLSVEDAAAGSAEPCYSNEVVDTTARSDLIWDDEARGLCIRVYPNGTQSFIFVYRIEDRQRFIRIGRSPRSSLKVARARAKKLRSIIDQGRDPAGEKCANSEVMPVENMIRYIADEAK
jgi:hypothetical protein